MQQQQQQLQQLQQLQQQQQQILTRRYDSCCSLMAESLLSESWEACLLGYCGSYICFVLVDIDEEAVLVFCLSDLIGADDLEEGTHG